MTPTLSPPPDPNRDLGLDGRLAQLNIGRLMNRDGTFNVSRRGLSLWDYIHPYHRLLTVTWGRFFVFLGLWYVVINALFASAYLMCGRGAIAGGDAPTFGGRFLNAFFFSVQTLATIGYGRMTPDSIAANVLVSIEALLGLLAFAFATGLLFSRFSRPTARIAFSENAVIAPYKSGRGLMFRIANSRSNELTDMNATVLLSRWEAPNGQRVRKFHPLALERERITFLPLQWVVVHPIDEASPLHGQTEAEFRQAEPEILILLSSMDETYSTSVHTRSSYRADEVVWGAKFRDIYETTSDGGLFINITRLGEFERMQLP